jgi:general secretion pathway protein G
MVNIMFKRVGAWFMVGVAVLVLLAAILLPRYRTAALNSREETLTVNLGTLRDVIKQYTQDKQKAPQSLQDLVDAGYFRDLPMDPMTNSTTTWRPIIDTSQGITDVRSGSTSMSLRGTAYNTW